MYNNNNIILFIHRFHAEYYDMKSSETIRDCLDESDIEDSDVPDDY